MKRKSSIHNKIAYISNIGNLVALQSSLQDSGRCYFTHSAFTSFNFPIELISNILGLFFGSVLFLLSLNWTAVDCLVELKLLIDS